MGFIIKTIVKKKVYMGCSKKKYYIRDYWNRNNNNVAKSIKKVKRI